MSDLKNIIQEPASTYGTLAGKATYNTIQSLREGVTYHSFYEVSQDGPFTIHEWCMYLHISERTLHRYKKESRNFDTLQSERILQLVLLNRFGKEVFGSGELYAEWLASENMALGGIIPKDILDSTFGIDLIKDELLRIQTGVLA